MSAKPKVFFTKTITPEKVLELFKMLNKPLEGKVGIKIHSGEAGNPNFLGPEIMKPTVDYLKGTVIEANTAGSDKFNSSRWKTEKHMKVMEDHGWSKNFPVSIMDEKGEMELPCPNGKQLKKNYVGVGIKDWDSILVLSHFKGHGMGGFGGALKQLSIGFASANGKAYIHTMGNVCDGEHVFDNFKPYAKQIVPFKEAMADAAFTVAEFYKGRIAYINIMKNLTVDCDCVGANAKLPCMKDIGILASLDPVAIDQACVDLVYKSDDPGKKDMIERFESLKAMRTLECAEELGMGKREYELITVE